VAGSVRLRHAAGVLEIAVLTVDDWPRWRELRLAALAEAPDAFGSRLTDWQGDGDREERWRDRLAIAGSHNVLALLDGRPSGMASGVPHASGVAELISMWVAPAARGQGVGDLLIGEIARWEREAGASALRLAVVEGNTPAAALYHRNGFRETGELGDLLPDGIRHEHILEKPLR
jgi:ribosomal protein S18 acetylase RimI-like enzyme